MFSVEKQGLLGILFLNIEEQKGSKGQYLSGIKT